MTKMAPSDVDWFALCLASETNQLHEAWYAGWVIRNRVEKGRWGSTYQGVVLARKQFSYFNEWTDGRKFSAIYESAMQGYAGDLIRQQGPAYRACAEDVMSCSAHRAPFGRDVMHYFSPVSMKPKGDTPPWAKTAKRLFTPSGVDPARFVFAVGVK